MTRILDGKALAATIRSEIRTQVGRLGIAPGLTVVLVGANPASVVYVRNKQKAALEVGFQGRILERPESITQAELLALIAELNDDPRVHGILVQLPLPRHIDENAVIQAVHPLKDVDCFHPENLGRLAAGYPRFLPCTPFGCVQLLARNGIATAGKKVVILGRSNIVGKPLALMLMQKPTPSNPTGGDATVTIVHTRTQEPAAECRQADILIAAIGKPRFVTADMVRSGAVVIDVGINRDDEGKLCGDVDYENVAPIVSAITPVPGGVGPMTIAMLLANTLAAGETARSSGSKSGSPWLSPGTSRFNS